MAIYNTISSHINTKNILFNNYSIEAPKSIGMIKDLRIRMNKSLLSLTL